MNDELTMRQAADTVYDLLRQFLHEPSEVNRSALLVVIKHYVLQGYRFKLMQDAVIVTKQEITHGSINTHATGAQSTRSNDRAH